MTMFEMKKVTRAILLSTHLLKMLETKKYENGKPFVNCHKRWGWVEIHWTDDQKDNWKLDQYTCPILSHYNIENPLLDVAGVPEEYRKKDLQSIYDKFSSEAGADVGVDIHAKLVEKQRH